MRYQIIDLGDEVFNELNDERFGIIDTDHMVGGHQMSKIVSRYHPFSHAKILCAGLNEGNYGKRTE